MTIFSETQQRDWIYTIPLLLIFTRSEPNGIIIAYVTAEHTSSRSSDDEDDDDDDDDTL